METEAEAASFKKLEVEAEALHAEVEAEAIKTHRFHITALDPAGRAGDPAGRVWEPSGRASKTGGRPGGAKANYNGAILEGDNTLSFSLR